MSEPSRGGRGSVIGRSQSLGDGLVFGAGRLDRRLSDVEGLLGEYREKEKDWGVLYLDYKPVTPRDRLLVEDLAVTMLINSRVSARAAIAAKSWIFLRPRLLDPVAVKSADPPVDERL